MAEVVSIETCTGEVPFSNLGTGIRRSVSDLVCYMENMLRKRKVKLFLCKHVGI
jgi:hypothetical protein